MPRLPKRTSFCRRTTPRRSVRLIACAIIMRCFRPTFLRRRKIRNDAADMKPRPPISISARITACPKPVHCVQVSYKTRPVTQVADVAVNNAGRRPQLVPLLDAMGSISAAVPSKIITAKVIAMILVGLSAFERFPINQPPDVSNNIHAVPPIHYVFRNKYHSIRNRFYYSSFGLIFKSFSSSRNPRVRLHKFLKNMILLLVQSVI